MRWSSGIQIRELFRKEDDWLKGWGVSSGVECECAGEWRLVAASFEGLTLLWRDMKGSQVEHYNGKTNLNLLYSDLFASQVQCTAAVSFNFHVSLRMGKEQRSEWPKSGKFLQFITRFPFPFMLFISTVTFPVCK